MTGRGCSPFFDGSGRRGDARIRIYDAAGALVADSVHTPDLRFPVERLTKRATASTTKVIGSASASCIGLPCGSSRASRGGTLARGVLPLAQPAELEHGLRDLKPGSAVRAALQGHYRAEARPTPGQRSLTLQRRAHPLWGSHRRRRCSYRSRPSGFCRRSTRPASHLRDCRRVDRAAVIIGLLMSARLSGRSCASRRRACALGPPRHASRLPARRSKRRDRRPRAHARGADGTAGRPHQAARILRGRRLARVQEPARLHSSRGRGDRLDRRSRRTPAPSGDADPRCRSARTAGNRRPRAGTNRCAARARGDLTGRPVRAPRGSRRRCRAARSPRSLSYRAPPMRCYVRVSSDRVAQVFENLLDNAASFAPSGSLVEVTMAADYATCIVRVEDRGPGFPPAHVDRVFDRFFTYRPDDGGRREHTGLGLSIARAIVEGYGGTIRATNRYEGGASVEVRLPIVTGVQPSSRSAQIASGAGSVSKL